MHLLSPRSPFAALLLATLPLPAQTSPPTPAATEAQTATAHIVFETVGPDGWRLRFSPTRIGSLLASERGRELWQPLVEPLFTDWQRALGGDANVYQGSRSRWLDYGGRVQLSLWFDVPEGRMSPEVHHGVIVLHPDGRTDMKALASDLTAVHTGLGEATRISLGGEFVRVRKLDELGVSEPMPVGNGLVLVLGRDADLPTLVPQVLATPPILDSKPPLPNTPALRVQIAVAALTRLAAQAAPRDVRSLEAFGITSLEQLALSLGTAGPHLQWEVAARFPNGPKGLMAALCTPGNTLSSLQDLVPADSEAARVGRFDFHALFQSVVTLLLDGWAAADTEPELRAEMRQELGLDLGDDLLAHATDEVAVFCAPMKEIARGTDVTWALLVKLRDPAKFQAGLETLLKHLKPHVQHAETVDVGGVPLHRYGNLVQYDTWLAIGHGVFFLGGGRDAEAQLTALLKAAAVPAQPAAERTLPARHADLARHHPAGLQGLGHADFVAFTQMPGSLWAMVLSEMVPGFGRLDADLAEEQAEALRTLLQEHRLTTVRSATGQADGTWRWRVYW